MARRPLNDAATIRRINEKNSLKPQQKTPWKELPEEVRANILRAKEAEEKRKETGGFEQLELKLSIYMLTSPP